MGKDGREDDAPALMVTADEFGAPDGKRRQMFADVLRSTAVASAGYCCLGCLPPAAYGLAQITAPSREALSQYDPPRNPLQDAAFAQGMAVGMVGRWAAPS